MKNYLILAAVAILFASCKQETKPVENVDYAEETLDVTTSVYPENVSKVFNAHGSVEAWNSFKTLEFTMKKPTGDEKTTVDLHNRRSLIETDAFKLGFDGTEAWVMDKGDNKYEGKPEFYYNLMFYFYGMPFVFADNGISYSEAEPLVYNDKEYPGIKISFDAGVGQSSDDEYILFYDADTNKMAWLGYTVTYFSKEKATSFNFVRYADWQTVNGIELPSKLEWYKAEGFTIGEMKNDLLFTDVKLTKTAQEDSFYKKPAVAVE